MRATTDAPTTTQQLLASARDARRLTDQLVEALAAYADAAQAGQRAAAHASRRSSASSEFEATAGTHRLYTAIAAELAAAGHAALFAACGPTALGHGRGDVFSANERALERLELP